MSAPDSIAVPLPPGPETDPFSPKQWGIFAAIADTIVTPFSNASGNRLLQHPLRRDAYDSLVKRLSRNISFGNDDLVTAYLGESATAQPEFRDQLFRMFGLYVGEADRKQIVFILNALNTRAGALLLTGHATPLDCLPIRDREQIILNWATSRIPILRGLARTLSTIVRSLWLRTSPAIGPAIGFPKTQANAAPPGAGFPFRFVQFPPATTVAPEIIETDVLIVGSGCGGAVAAKTLAEAGLNVLVVDKSYYWAPEYFPMTEAAAATHMFVNGGALPSDDGSTTVLAGSTWGGGGTVNWSASLQPQGAVRREWADKFGLTHFRGAAFQADLDAVCQRMGVSYAAVEHNKGNQVLLEGARKLGWNAKAVPQNTGGEVHSDGYCTRGCRDCGKKGPIVTFLPDAANSGAQFIEGFDVKEVLFDETNTAKEKIATGVRGIWTSRDGMGGVAGKDKTVREVILKARRTIISGGSLYTPHLLQKSKLKNRNIGRHLHLHPVSLLAAVWDEEVKPWEGPILTSVVSEFDNLDGEGYGVKLEATTMMPSSFIPFFEWRGGLAFKEFAVKMRHMTGYISLARDRYGGRVYTDPADGRCRIQYHPHAHDKKSILEGLARLAEIMYVEGAREIHVPIPNLEPFVRPSSEPGSNVSVSPNQAPSSTDVEFQAWVAKLRRVGFPTPDTPFASAHQMGSCRMGTSPKNSVVDWKGRVWGTKGLYIADASVFPSASGVNPMITVMGIARGISRGIVDEEKGLVVSGVKARL